MLSRFIMSSAFWPTLNLFHKKEQKIVRGALASLKRISVRNKLYFHWMDSNFSGGDEASEYQNNVSSLSKQGHWCGCHNKQQRQSGHQNGKTTGKYNIDQLIMVFRDKNRYIIYTEVIGASTPVYLSTKKL